MKIIFITGWVLSGLGKWITSASLWRLIKSAWYDVNMIKMDPYLQVDAWTMSPYEHWEVFVTDDWAETDLDIWNYERFTDISLYWDNNITTWKVYLSVINKERKWDYLGKTVQVVPHITNEIKERILKTAKNSPITIVEVWWTVWDIESLPFFEAIRQMKNDIWKDNVLFVHVAPVLYLCFSWDFKTKPIQHSVKELMSVWIHPDILVTRCEHDLPKWLKEKLSLFCDLEKDSIIEAKDAKSIYEVPLVFKNQNLDKILERKLWLSMKNVNLRKWKKAVDTILNPSSTVTIWIVWKYAQFKDAYTSLMEALAHAWANNDVKVMLNWIQSDDLEKPSYAKFLTNLVKKWMLDGILIPWWFGGRGVEWKINAIRFARENNIPFLGICLWLQTAVMEFARNVCGLKWANSTEFDKKAVYPVIDYMPEQREIQNKWWTMRLWAYPANLLKWSLAHKLYWKLKVSERHRHRFEVNPEYHEILEKKWLVISWKSPDGRLVEFVELKKHPYFIATQAHPEFKSRLDNPHPLFDGLVKAAKKVKK